MNGEVAEEAVHLLVQIGLKVRWQLALSPRVVVASKSVGELTHQRGIERGLLGVVWVEGVADDVGGVDEEVDARGEDVVQLGFCVNRGELSLLDLRVREVHRNPLRVHVAERDVLALEDGERQTDGIEHANDELDARPELLVRVDDEEANSSRVGLAASPRWVVDRLDERVLGVDQRERGFVLPAPPRLRLGRERLCLAVERLLMDAERRKSTRLDVVGKVENHRVDLIDSLLDLLDGADVLGVKVERVPCAAVGEKPGKRSSQKPPRLAHDRGVVRAEGLDAVLLDEHRKDLSLRMARKVVARWGDMHQESIVHTVLRAQHAHLVFAGDTICLGEDVVDEE